MRRLFLLACALGFAIGCGGGGGEVAAADAGAETDAEPVPQTLSIKAIDVYQAVQIHLVRDGAKVELAARNAPVIARREGLLRVSVETGKGWKKKRVEGRLTITTSKGSKEHKVTRDVSIFSSSDGDLGSTFNFELPKDAIARDASYVVELGPADAPFARWPAEGSEPFEAIDSGSLKVKIVPVRYDFDGTERLPDTSPETIEAYKSALYALYPLQSIDVSVREPWPWKDEVAADGSGWSSLLSAIVNLRNSEKPATDVYYYGLFVPADSYWKYCQRGCVAGLSNLVTDPRDAFGRASIGVGFFDDSIKTMAHELGHAHGRSHAPCGDARGIDRKFPYSGGEIGVFGWDLVEKKLVDSGHTDFMGYCEPSWVSDYTYVKLLDRVSFVSKPAEMVGVDTTPKRWRFVHVEPNGTLRWGQTTVATWPPLSDPKTVTFETKEGDKRTVTGHWYPHDDLEGGLLVVPDPEVAPARLRVELPAFGPRALSIAP